MVTGVTVSNPGNGLSTNPDFFPIGVWFQTATSNAQNYANIGVNTFVGQWEGNTSAALQALKNAGETVITQQDSVGLTDPNNGVIKAWELPDEPDNAQPNGEGGYGPCVAPSTLVAEYRQDKAADPSRPVYVNFGQGVANTGYTGRGSCTGDTAMYSEYAQGADIVSFDVYPVNDGYPLSIVATGVDNLRRWVGNKPLFALIETTPEQGGAGPTPAQIQAESWLALIHGANGIVYYCHIFSPTFIEAGCLTLPSVVATMKADDAQIASLAPVLNSNTIANGVAVTSTFRVDTMEKSYGGATYVFSEAVDANGGSASFSIPNAGNGTVTVLGENRTLTMSSGRFTDTFGGYGVHLYQIPATGETGPTGPTGSTGETGSAPVNSVPPTIMSGAPQVGNTLTATTGTWTNSPTGYSYQWEDCNTAGESCSSIGGATASSYKLTASDLGHTLRVVVSASNAGGSTPATSAATATVLPAAPTNTALPTVSGSAVEGQTLSASKGTWSVEPTSVGYQWEDCNAFGEGCLSIGGATASSYKLTASDVGHTLRVVVSASNAGGSTPAISGTTPTVLPDSPLAPVNVKRPSIGGTAQVGQALTATAGEWENAATVTKSYQWEDCSQTGGACIAISGATGSSYVLTSSDVGDTVTVVETAKNSAGTGNATAVSTGTVTTSAYRTFYIDYTSGSDSNSGTSEASPWKRAPGMRGYAGSYSHTPGDHFVFKGGVTWPNATFPLAATGSGGTTNRDYYGANKTWHAGASYSAPTFNAENAEITSSDEHSGGGHADIFFDLRGNDYITVEGIALKGLKASSGALTYGNCEVINMQGDEHITINRISVSEETTDQADECKAVLAATYGNFAGESVVENSSFTGNGSSYFEAIRCVGNVKNNVITGLIGQIHPCGHGTVSGNRLNNCGYPSFPAGGTGIHADAIQVDAANGAFYIHDNVISNTGREGSNECESMLIGNHTETDYVWNNVLYGLRGNPPALTQQSEPGEKAFFWNNTIEGGSLGTGACLRAGHSGSYAEIAYQDNLCITSHMEVLENLETSKLVNGGDVKLEPTVATSDGYTTSQTYVYSPTEAGSPTVGKGENLATKCSGELFGLCTDTSYAGARGTKPRTAVGKGNWDVGAYMW